MSNTLITDADERAALSFLWEARNFRPHEEPALKSTTWKALMRAGLVDFNRDVLRSSENYHFILSAKGMQVARAISEAETGATGG